MGLPSVVVYYKVGASSFTKEITVKTAILTLVSFLFYPYIARADTCPIIDVDKWTVNQKTRIEFRTSDEVVAYLGLDIEYVDYSNPNNPAEFARVISRHVPLIFGKQKQANDRLFRDLVTSLYVQKEQEDRLGELDKKTDTIIYVHWKIKEDPVTKKDMHDGNIDVCFLKSNGDWFFIQNKPVSIQFLSERVSNDKSRNVLVGMKYQVDADYQILKINRDDFERLIEESKKK